MNLYDVVKDWANRLILDQYDHVKLPEQEQDMQDMMESDHQFLRRAWEIKSRQTDIKHRIHARKQLDDFNKRIDDSINQRSTNK